MPKHYEWRNTRANPRAWNPHPERNLRIHTLRKVHLSGLQLSKLPEPWEGYGCNIEPDDRGKDASRA
jgi:hypothetical protein